MLSAETAAVLRANPNLSAGNPVFSASNPHLCTANTIFAAGYKQVLKEPVPYAAAIAKKTKGIYYYSLKKANFAISNAVQVKEAHKNIIFEEDIIICERYS
jgi:hypothetical protein